VRTSSSSRAVCRLHAGPLAPGPADLAAALPYVLDLGNVMVGGNDPLPIDLPAWTGTAERPDVLAYFGPRGRGGHPGPSLAGPPGPGQPASRRGLNYDLFPRDEFSTPARTGP